MMFQKNLQKLRPQSPPQNSNKLKKQRENSIDQRRGKNPLRRTILMRIDIISEQGNIKHQTGHRHRSDLRLVRPQEIEKIFYRKSGVELDEIIDDKAYDRRDQPQDQAQA